MNLQILQQLQDVFASLTTPGSQTSEGKNTRATLILLGVLLIGEVAHIYMGNSADPGSVTVVLGTLIALVTKSALYTRARSQVKGEVAKLIGSERISDLLREALTPPAPPPAIPAPVQTPFALAVAPPIKPAPRRKRSGQANVPAILILGLAAGILFSTTGCKNIGNNAEWSGEVSYNPETKEIKVGVGKAPVK